MSAAWYCKIDGTVLGEFAEDELKRLARDGVLGRGDAVRHGAAGPWHPAADVGWLTFPPDPLTAISTTPRDPPPAADRPLVDRVAEQLLATRPAFDALDYNAPGARAERLLVLAGGRAPRELFRVRRLMLHEPFKQRQDQLGGFDFTELIFTDCGLLVVPVAFSPSTRLARSLIVLGIVTCACLVFLIGLVTFVVRSRKQDEAEQSYYDTSLRLLGLKPIEIFALYPSADFLPADEIDALKRPDPTKLVLTFRGQRHVLEMFPGQQEPRTDFRIPSQELLADWLDEARAERTDADGTPPEPGLAAVIEWCRRTTAGDPPPWVAEVLRRAEAEWDGAAELFYRLVPEGHRGAVYVGLGRVGTPEADAWRAWLRRRGLLHSRVFFGIALACLLALLPAIAGTAIVGTGAWDAMIEPWATAAIGLSIGAWLFGLFGGIARKQFFSP